MGEKNRSDHHTAADSCHDLQYHYVPYVQIMLKWASPTTVAGGQKQDITTCFFPSSVTIRDLKPDKYSSAYTGAGLYLCAIFQATPPFTSRRFFNSICHDYLAVILNIINTLIKHCVKSSYFFDIGKIFLD